MVNIQKNTKLLRIIFFAMGLYVFAFAVFIYIDEYKLLENKGFTYGEVKDFKSCFRSWIRPCYRPVIIYRVNFREYSIKGHRIYKDPKNIFSRKYLVIYNKRKPFIGREQKSKKINYFSFYRLSMIFSFVGFIFMVVGMFGKNQIIKMYKRNSD